MLATAPPAPLLPDAPPGVHRPATVDPRPYSLVVPGFGPDGKQVKGVYFRIVIGRPGGYAPGGVSYFPNGTR